MSDIAEKRRLLQTMRMLSTQTIMFHQAIADNMGLNITEYKCLDILARFGSMTAGRLTELSGLTTGAITGVVDRLERAGYVKRMDNPKDRRSVIIELTWNTDKKKVYALTFNVLEQKMDKMSASYTDKELSFFMEFMNKIVGILHDETARLSKVRKFT